MREGNVICREGKAQKRESMPLIRERQAMVSDLLGVGCEGRNKVQNGFVELREDRPIRLYNFRNSNIHQI